MYPWNRESLAKSHRIKTVWSEEGLQEIPERFRSLYSIALPGKYAIYILFGITAVLFRPRSVEVATSPQYTDFWAVMIIVTTALAAAGLIFCKEKLELYASIANIVGIATYPVLLLWFAFTGDVERFPAGFGLMGFIVLPIWRVTDIVRVIRRREEK